MSQASGMLGEQRPHLRGALQVVAVAVEPEAVGLVQPRAGLDAQQRVVGLRVLLVRVVQVVGAPAAGCRGPWRSPAAPGGSSSRWTARGPSARRRSSPCRRCPGSPRPPAGRGPPCRPAATCSPRPTGSRSWRSGPCRSARAGRGRTAACGTGPRGWPARRCGRGCACPRWCGPAASCGCTRPCRGWSPPSPSSSRSLSPKSNGARSNREPGV